MDIRNLGCMSTLKQNLDITVLTLACLLFGRRSGVWFRGVFWVKHYHRHDDWFRVLLCFWWRRWKFLLRSWLLRLSLQALFWRLLLWSLSRGFGLSFCRWPRFVCTHGVCSALREQGDDVRAAAGGFRGRNICRIGSTMGKDRNARKNGVGGTLSSQREGVVYPS